MTRTVSEVAPELLDRLQIDAGLLDPPTPLTWHARMAPSGVGDMAGDWADKPHRVIYDLCRHIEALEYDQARLRAALDQDGPGRVLKIHSVI